jgi:Lon protease-like protein
LPLHVFEPRYRTMTRDVLEGNSILSIAELQPGYQSDYQGRPAVYPICGVGRVVWNEALPDGRYNLLVRGEARARIDRELAPERPYREISVTTLTERGVGSITEAGVQSLVALCRSIAPYLPEKGAPLLEMVEDAESPSVLVDLLSGTLVQDPDVRRELLGELDVAARLAQVSEELARIRAVLAGGEAPS